MLASGLFSGYAPLASGTVGTAVALGIYLLLPPLSSTNWILLLVPFCLVSVLLSSIGESYWGPDPGKVVVDEFAGFFVTVALLPQSVLLGGAAFFLFRVLDIVKPPPARQAEALPGGWGIVADDVMAGIYGNLILRAGLVLLSPG
jgi:phosphatidylglycerophosphatase A